jgi:hypothetical protein
MENITNPNFLYLHSSIATKSQVYHYLQKCIKRFEEILDETLEKEIIVNTVTKFDGTPLKHSYVWVKSVEVANLLLNRTKDGVERVEETPDLDHDVTEDEKRLFDFLSSPTPDNCSWAELMEEEERLISKARRRNIKIPMTPLFDFGTIELTEEQKTKYPDMSEIQIKIFPLSVPLRPGYMRHKLFANHVSKDVSEKQIQKIFEPYSTKTSSDNRKSYPIVYIDRKSNPTSISVTYCLSTFDAVFAILMNKRVVISDKCTLNFELYRENDRI